MRKTSTLMSPTSPAGPSVAFSNDGALQMLMQTIGRAGKPHEVPIQWCRPPLRSESLPLPCLPESPAEDDNRTSIVLSPAAQPRQAALSVAPLRVVPAALPATPQPEAPQPEAGKAAARRIADGSRNHLNMQASTDLILAAIRNKRKETEGRSEGPRGAEKQDEGGGQLSPEGDQELWPEAEGQGGLDRRPHQDGAVAQASHGPRCASGYMGSPRVSGVGASSPSLVVRPFFLCVCVFALLYVVCFLCCLVFVLSYLVLPCLGRALACLVVSWTRSCLGLCLGLGRGFAFGLALHLYLYLSLYVVLASAC